MRDNVINLKVCQCMIQYLAIYPMRGFLLSKLQVVLPNGDVVKTASRARKSAAGSVSYPFL